MDAMKSISQRELRNDSGQVLREAELGQEFTVTRRGTPVARIVPLEAEHGRRPARRPAVFSTDDLVRSEVASEEILVDLRDER